MGPATFESVPDHVDGVPDPIIKAAQAWFDSAKPVDPGTPRPDKKGRILQFEQPKGKQERRR